MIEEHVHCKECGVFIAAGQQYTFIRTVPYSEGMKEVVTQLCEKCADVTSKESTAWYKIAVKDDTSFCTQCAKALRPHEVCTIAVSFGKVIQPICRECSDHLRKMDSRNEMEAAWLKATVAGWQGKYSAAQKRIGELEGKVNRKDAEIANLKTLFTISEFGLKACANDLINLGSQRRHHFVGHSNGKCDICGGYIGNSAAHWHVPSLDITTGHPEGVCRDCGKQGEHPIHKENP